MEYDIRYKPSFATIFVTLSPGERITAEAGAMISMDSRLSMKSRVSGNIFGAWLRSTFGGESLFVNEFKNDTAQPLTLVLSQATIGDIAGVELTNSAICFQPGAYIAHTPGIQLGLRWAGFTSGFAGEGFFKLKLSGTGRVFFGAYGGLTKKIMDGDLIVDNGHLVAYSPSIKMGLRFSGGLLASMTSQEGLVNRLQGRGEVYLQSRSLDGLVSFLRSKVR
ncbi:TIGR00266 family protein [Phormidium sp. CCY1219]|uniref:TIGR00266 family protein n=1 Tax=Phormidium sp. CCY1219 TaxID=2886104 RepID=UPI002D1F88BE|nr:TIGR00266 family protein [Phormidium sp. CCY1219]MEB3829273.1 TIGR00266 family protein [Phormidium sp. CCY1219]